MNGPLAVKDLSVQSWTCSKCGTYHESRDYNAALNIAEAAKNMLNR
ncbi:MAG: transposase [Candidatus Anaerobiospirillum pullicola]|uniref:Transposase n=1 Tax=Candidatus Anaerobiospirillum pullicola TaxID=2838451 RepID=A0A948TFT9_9GAMM|nr:transposase [Candidatus Anaerobiospirillum pullicola]